MASIIGASAALVVTPYYNKPTQEGLFQHFRRVAEEVKSLPIVLYNVPSRTGCDLLPETANRLRTAYGNIVGIKEASGNLQRIKDLRSCCGEDFMIYSGDDGSCVTDILDGGANGVVSVSANVMPRQMQLACRAALSGSKEIALRMHESLKPLHTALFLEPSPCPTKFILSDLGKIENAIRMPLLPLSANLHNTVREAYASAKDSFTDCETNSVYAQDALPSCAINPVSGTSSKIGQEVHAA
eukprot:GHVQ01017591.1.p1 GENE.GHVQ01017591.1~~GHVQ01017591.1.p1  ORF type:complete len:242 (+),score=23.84 GHVQ01017591.1:668-1393(+)